MVAGRPGKPVAVRESLPLPPHTYIIVQNHVRNIITAKIGSKAYLRHTLYFVFSSRVDYKVDGVGSVYNRHCTAEALPISKNRPFSKIVVTLETILRFRCP